MDNLKLFPAYAGVIPVKPRPLSETRAFPRLRGGDPTDSITHLETDNFSPPTRG